MGFLKGMKDMKHMVAEAPDLLAQSTTLAANARAMSTAATQPGVVYEPPADDTPIAGVSLEVFVAVSRSVADGGYDVTKAAQFAADHGVAAADWDTAAAGWNTRLQTQPATARRFNALYTAR